MNGVQIGAGSIVGVGAVVTEGTIIPANSLVLGMPAKVVRSTEARDWEQIRHAAAHYVKAVKEVRESILLRSISE
jgi:carbonic anhydrase/acetyltransferase-like protein (isoleucine patch superfamily)